MSWMSKRGHQQNCWTNLLFHLFHCCAQQTLIENWNERGWDEMENTRSHTKSQWKQGEYDGGKYDATEKSDELHENERWIQKWIKKLDKKGKKKQPTDIFNVYALSFFRVSEWERVMCPLVSVLCMYYFVIWLLLSSVLPLTIEAKYKNCSILFYISFGCVKIFFTLHTRVHFELENGVWWINLLKDRHAAFSSFVTIRCCCCCCLWPCVRVSNV